MVNKYVPKGQNWLIQRMQELGYSSDPNGVCYGVAHMGMQAILSNDVKTFDDRILEIADIPADKIRETIEAYRNKSTQISSTTKTEDIAAFFEGVEVYQQPNIYPHLFKPQQALTSQNAIKTMPLVLSHKLEKQGGIIGNINCSNGVYTKEDLQEYFKILSSSMQQISQPVAFVLGGVSHAITVGYDPIKKEWLFIDANQLPTQRIELNSIDLIADKVLTALSRNNVAIFSTDIYGLKECDLFKMSEKPTPDNLKTNKNHYIITENELWYFDASKRNLEKLSALENKSMQFILTKLKFEENHPATNEELGLITSYTGHTRLKSNQDELININKQLKENEEWKKIHAITPKKSLALDSKGRSWLKLAIKVNDFEKIKQLVDAGSEIKNDFNSVDPTINN